MLNAGIDLKRLRFGRLAARSEYHPVLGSTNDRARELAGKCPTESAMLVVAGTQTAGRGRGANRWWTGDGGLAFSLLLDCAQWGIAQRFQAMLPLAAAVAIVEVSSSVAKAGTVGLHWPNDVFAENRKLAGVLVEGLADGRHILGIGINVNNEPTEAPPELAARMISMAELARRPQDRTDVLAAVLERLEPALEQLASQPSALAANANTCCLQHGRRLTIDSGGRRTSGVCAGIAPDGALVLDTPSGRQVCYSGVLVHDA